jgi:glutathione synthase/RimK-type ligase-like ATP-grasp enzyme
MLAIHIRKESFSDRWIEYCQSRKIDFIKVNIYDSGIISHLLKSNVKILLAHPTHDDYKTSLISKSILLAAEKAGIKVFPDTQSYWHFDDKLSEKYLFEALGIPHIPTNVFYSRDEALEWMLKATFPVVFKLRGGAGAQNVFLLRNKKEATYYINKMFSKGLNPQRSPLHDFKNKINNHNANRDWRAAFKRLPGTIRNIMSMNNEMHREKGYFMVQDFLPDNNYDIRSAIYGEKAFIFRRINRPGDFRASGSGVRNYEYHESFESLVDLTFKAARKIGTQAMSFDILFGRDKKPYINEISYTMPAQPIYENEGYWDSSLVFHPGPVWLEDIIIEHVLGSNGQ